MQMLGGVTHTPFMCTTFGCRSLLSRQLSWKKFVTVSGVSVTQYNILIATGSFLNLPLNTLDVPPAPKTDRCAAGALLPLSNCKCAQLMISHANESIPSANVTAVLLSKEVPSNGVRMSAFRTCAYRNIININIKRRMCQHHTRCSRGVVTTTSDRERIGTSSHPVPELSVY